MKHKGFAALGALRIPYGRSAGEPGGRQAQPRPEEGQPRPEEGQPRPEEGQPRPGEMGSQSAGGLALGARGDAVDAPEPSRQVGLVGEAGVGGRLGGRHAQAEQTAGRPQPELP